ncbi:hypothetical protein SGLAM104S_04614 [Streptomyces glaucescens]
MNGANRRSTLCRTSLDVIGEPSSHLMPSFSVNFQVLPPSVVVPGSVARSPTTSCFLPSSLVAL